MLHNGHYRRWFDKGNAALLALLSGSGRVELRVADDAALLRERQVGHMAANEEIDREVRQMFAMVSEALAKATAALLEGNIQAGKDVVRNDKVIDDLTQAVEEQVWECLDRGGLDAASVRYLVSVLLILPELERSADLAEHVAQRAVTSLGLQMTPLSRGIVQRMTEVAVDMWRVAADAYADREARSVSVDEADEEMDILHERLSGEIAAGAMPPRIAAEVALLARFYERLGDHAVNLTRRIDQLPARESVPPI
jgi:phosphate transport system protein